ncbi:MAG: hypothetical protein SW127_23190 [Actinomycetota bacterium]|nr:hypothetical protein [Actinomycetota bacterium]
MSFAAEPLSGVCAAFAGVAAIDPFSDRMGGPRHGVSGRCGINAARDSSARPVTGAPIR